MEKVGAWIQMVVLYLTVAGIGLGLMTLLAGCSGSGTRLYIGWDQATEMEYHQTLKKEEPQWSKQGK